MRVIYVNVNEEGVPYQVNDELEPALATLEEFPNDTVVIADAEGPSARSLRKGLDTSSFWLS